MNAKQLYELMKPVWDAVPELNPTRLSYTGAGVQIFSLNTPDGPWMIYEEDAAALSRDAMVTWLADRCRAVRIEQRNDCVAIEFDKTSPIDPATVAGDAAAYAVPFAKTIFKPTLIEALAQAVLNLKGQG